MDLLEVVSKVIELSQVESQFSEEVKNLRCIVQSLFSYLQKLENNYEGINLDLLLEYMNEAKELLEAISKQTQQKKGFLGKLKANIGNMFVGGKLSQIRDLTTKLNNHIQIIHLGVSLQSRKKSKEGREEQRAPEIQLPDTLQMNQELPTTLAISEDVEIQNSAFFKLVFWATSSKSEEIARKEKFDLMKFCLADLPHSLGRINLMELPAEQRNYLSKVHCILNYETEQGNSQENREEEKKIQKDIQHSDTKPMDKLSVPRLEHKKSKNLSDRKSNLSGIKEELENSKSESVDDMELFATAQEQVEDLRDLFFTSKVSWRQKYKITLQDMSMNGTYVNDERVGKGNKVVLKNGDRICLVKQKNAEGILGFLYQEITD